MAHIVKLEHFVKKEKINLNAEKPNITLLVNQHMVNIKGGVVNNIGHT